jgi:hypothetical protein
MGSGLVVSSGRRGWAGKGDDTTPCTFPAGRLPYDFVASRAPRCLRSTHIAPDRGSCGDKLNKGGEELIQTMKREREKERG